MSAQDIVVKNIAPLTLDISARTSGRVDSNGHDCMNGLLAFQSKSYSFFVRKQAKCHFFR